MVFIVSGATARATSSSSSGTCLVLVLLLGERGEGLADGCEQCCERTTKNSGAGFFGLSTEKSVGFGRDFANKPKTTNVGFRSGKTDRKKRTFGFRFATLGVRLKNRRNSTHKKWCNPLTDLAHHQTPGT